MKSKTFFLILLTVISGLSFGGIPDNTETITYLYGLQESGDTAADSTAEVIPPVPDNYRYPGRAMIFSGLVPGLGEYYSGDWKRAVVFAGVEVVSWILYASYNSKGDDQTVKYESYADDHWDFAKWITDYYTWENADTTFRSMFTNQVGHYEDIYASSHSIGFYYTDFTNPSNPIEISYSNNEQVFWDELFLPLLGGVDPYTDVSNRIESDENFQVIKDQTYYENIGKYNHFYAGWEDTYDPEDPTHISDDYIFDNDGYLVAKTPTKWKYRDMRAKANDYQTLAGYAVSAVMANHVASMIDAVFTTRAWNAKNAPQISARTFFNPDNKYGVGGVEVSLSW